MQACWKWRGLGLVACALSCAGHSTHSESNTIPPAAAGKSASGEGGSGGTAMQTPSGGMAGTTSFSCVPRVSNAGGGAPYPLLCGDEGCPNVAPTERTCSGPRLSCVYPGLPNDYGGWELTVRCECVDEQWICVESDDHGRSKCPIPLSSSQRCDPSLTPECLYPTVGQPYSAACLCGGEVGGDPNGWICLL